MSVSIRNDAYTLYSVDEGQELCTAENIVGFFVDSEESWRTFYAVRYSLRGQCVHDDVEHLEVRVIDSTEKVLGSYSVSHVHIEEVEHEGGAALRLSGYLLDHPHPDAPTAWGRWRESSNLELNAWVTLSPTEREAWLDSVRLHHDWESPDSEVDASGGVYEVDGRNITDRAGLYCALGEALRGPGGYFGSTLDALRDCLGGGFGLTPPFVLNWHSVKTAQNHLGDSYVNKVVNTMRSAGVSVNLC
ncbi:barstar family protein [Streptomyces sp. NA02950]|uniref:barstar family protein n=1 Tax=Streptomyces sp. NA02950 TaxID=2742137 RepID=UPI0020CB1526|nr:barstar family protein [Streptomyces sp. NA02950]